MLNLFVMTKPKQTRAASKAETSAQLIKTARQHFFEHGYAGTSMDALAEDAGLTRGAIYHNFGGKEGLFEAVIQQIDDELSEKLLDVEVGGTTLLEAFIATCCLYLDLTLDPEVQQLVFQDAPAVLGQRLRDLDTKGSIAPLAEALTELIAEGTFVPADVESLAVMLNGAMIDAALWIARQANKQTALQTAKASLETLILGLSKT
ncbi:MAG: TetR/AcrR family transcriptional regulator [Deinococcota bacterium]